MIQGMSLDEFRATLTAQYRRGGGACPARIWREDPRRTLFAPSCPLGGGEVEPVRQHDILSLLSCVLITQPGKGVKLGDFDIFMALMYLRTCQSAYAWLGHGRVGKIV